MAYQFIISQRKRKQDRGFCANLRCRVVLESPVHQYTFMLDGHSKVFQRTFCVECARRIKRASKSPIYFEVVQI